MKPTLREEKRLWKKGYNLVIGLDEAGRGPLAGPVVACAVAIDFKSLKKENRDIFNLIKKEANDSKKLSVKKREKLYKIIIKCPEITWGRGKVSEKIIDKINILEATKIAMKKAIRDLESKVHKKRKEYLIIDGNIALDYPLDQKSIIKADEKVLSCSLASIIAKVSRDRMMRNYHKKYSIYGFDKHKGYPTKFHRKMIKKNGASVIHRKSFSLLKKK